MSTGVEPQHGLERVGRVRGILLDGRNHGPNPRLSKRQVRSYDAGSDRPPLAGPRLAQNPRPAGGPLCEVGPSASGNRSEGQISVLVGCTLPAGILRGPGVVVGSHRLD